MLVGMIAEGRERTTVGQYRVEVSGRSRTAIHVKGENACASAPQTRRRRNAPAARTLRNRTTIENLPVIVLVVVGAAGCVRSAGIPLPDTLTHFRTGKLRR
jgi:hypothetical protein